MTPSGSFGLPEFAAGAMMLALNAYVLMGGADFGGGVWDLLARGPRRDAQRALIAGAIAPIWEANHVWLIVVVVMLFTGFPDVFALLGVYLHIPISLMLVGIVLRGSAFIFRSYGAHDDATQRRCGRVFAGASIVTPVLLGIIAGTIASGALRIAIDVAAPTSTPALRASFAEVFVAPWLAPFPIAVGVLALALFAYLAAVYLTVAARDSEVREDFRARALGSAAAVFAAALGALLVAHWYAPAVRERLLMSAPALALQIATALSAVTAIWALVVRRWRLARLAAAGQVSLILWGWALVQFPFLVPGVVTIRDAAAPAVTLSLLLWVLGGGAVVLVPSLIYLYRTFNAGQEARYAKH